MAYRNVKEGDRILVKLSPDKIASATVTRIGGNTAGGKGWRMATVEIDGVTSYVPLHSDELGA